MPEVILALIVLGTIAALFLLAAYRILKMVFPPITRR